MAIETTTAGILLLIAIMTVVTLATRFGGAFVMSFVKINPRIESFIVKLVTPHLKRVSECLQTYLDDQE